MAVSVTCPGCRTSYPVTEDLLGKKIRCKKCQETFTAAASRNGAGRSNDERIQTKPGAAKVAVARQTDMAEVDDESPRNGNGQARPAAQSATRTHANNRTVLIIAAAAGGLVAAMGGVTLWALNRTSDESEARNEVTPPPPRRVTPILETTEPKAGKAETNGKANPSVNPSASLNPELTATQAISPRVLPADFYPDVVNQVKNSAVMIQVTREDGGGDGSGWVAEPNGIIITNSHVVGMKEPAKPPPEKIEVILYAGDKDKEERHTAKLLALDRDEDLAVLQIKSKNLPDPLPIAPSAAIVEGQKLMTLGFPLGRMLKQAVDAGGGQETLLKVKTRPTYCAGRFNNKDGSVKFIQLEGGVDPGNSGGAVVDTSGHVVAVVVAEMSGTNIKFAIPSEYASLLLQGRVLRIIPGQAIKSGGGARQPLTAMIADPMRRLRKVTAEVWAGPKPDPKKGEKPVRPAAEQEPAPLPGDSAIARADLNYDPDRQTQLGESHTATAELTLPPVTDGQVYWFRPHYVTKDGKDRWGEAMVLEMGRYPVEPRGGNLALKHKADTERRVRVSSRDILEFDADSGSRGAGDLSLTAELTERTRSVDAQSGDARVSFQYTDLHLGDKDLENAMRRQLRGMLEQVKYLKVEATVTKDGRIRSPKEDTAEVSARARPILKLFNMQVLEGLETVAVPLPGKDMQPGETWNVDTHFTFHFSSRPENALFRTTCKFVGVRSRNGREEAVIEMTGRIVRGDENNNNPGGGDGAAAGGPRGGPRGGPQDGPGDRGGEGGNSGDQGGRGRRRGVTGTSRGAALVDLATGYITLAHLHSDLDVEFPIRENLTVRAGLSLRVNLQRGLSKAALKPVEPAEVEALLPNQPKIYNPYVGALAPEQAAALRPATSAVEDARTAAMKSDVLQQVKKRTVLIKVQRADGGGEGSGWLAEPNGIVITNSHVVGMLDKAARPPEKVEVVLYAGTPEEARLPAKLLSVDREDDLAVLQLQGAKDLPEPFTVVPSAGFVGGEALSVVGFPRGSSLVKGAVSLGATDLKTEVKTRSTRVSGLIHNVDGSLKYVQVEGGADPGNSGGPVVDSKGNVRAVLVAGFPGRQIVFCIPGEYAARVLQGYPMEVKPGRAYLDGSVARQPIEIQFADPVKRVQKVAVDYWVGGAGEGKPRPGTEQSPKVEPGDGPRQTAVLSYDAQKQLATGEFVLPEVSPGQVIWLQPHFTNGTGKPQWSRATIYAPDGPPVDRRPARLFVQHKVGTKREMELTSYSRFRYNLLGEEHRQGDPIKVTLSENVLRVAKQGASKGTATVQLEYKDLELDFAKIFPQLKDIPQGQQFQSELNRLLRPLLGLIRGVITVVTVNDRGEMKLKQANYRQLPPQVWFLMSTFNSQVISSLQALTFPLPNQQVAPGFTWKHKSNLFVASQNRYDEAVFEMTFKYVGVRDRGGKQEAVVEIEGHLAKDTNAKSIDAKEIKEGKTPPAQPEGDKPPPDDPDAPRGLQAKKPAGPKDRKGLYGLAHGYAFVDVAGGYVSEVHLFVDLDVEMTVPDPDTKVEVPVTAGGTMELTLKRRD
jgi:predicted Zn finger-like uncharacterized protein